MGRFALVMALLLIGGPAAHAESLTGGGGTGSATAAGVGSSGPAIGVFTRNIGGAQIKQAFILRRGGGNSYKGRNGRKRLPRCRTGLFGRVANAPCRRGRRMGYRNRY